MTRLDHTTVQQTTPQMTLILAIRKGIFGFQFIIALGIENTQDLHQIIT